MFSRSASTERPMAIAGLFNSWESPAAREPSVVSRSRCVSSISTERPSSAGSPMSTVGKEAMRELYGDGAFPDGGRDTFHGQMPDVARTEDAGNVRLEKVRVAGERPSARPSVLLREAGSGEDEAIL